MKSEVWEGSVVMSNSEVSHQPNEKAFRLGALHLRNKETALGPASPRAWGVRGRDPAWLFVVGFSFLKCIFY